MKTVAELLEGKGNTIWSIGPDHTVYDAIALMAERGIGAVLVVERDRLVGILSERDYARRVILKGKASKDTLVREIMTTTVIHVAPDHTINHCMETMTDSRIRHLPVLVGDRLVGVLSIGDVVKAIISDKQSHIEQLEDYIKTAG